MHHESLLGSHSSSEEWQLENYPISPPRRRRGPQTGPHPNQPESPGYIPMNQIPDLVIPDGRPRSYQGKIIGTERNGIIRPLKQHGDYVLLIQPHNTVEVISDIHWIVLASNYVDEERARRQALRNAVRAAHAGVRGAVYHEPPRPSPVWNPYELQVESISPNRSRRTTTPSQSGSN